MRDNVFLIYILADILFVVCGGLLLIFALVTESIVSQVPTVGTVARNLLFQQCPLNAAIANAVLVFVTFLFSVPAMVMPMTRGWLKLQGYLTCICALFTMILGLTVWYQTLKTRENLHGVWNTQSTATQSLLQQKLNCCGYTNTSPPDFVVDATCPNSFAASSTIGCVGPFSSFGNNLLDMVFTGAFGIVGVDVILIMATAMLQKNRKEQARYRHIDEKSGPGII